MRMCLIAILTACVLIFVGFFALAGVFGEMWPAYGQVEQKTLVGNEYADEYVQVRMAKAEGRYVIALSVLDDDLIVRYGDGQVNSVMTQLGTIFDEQRVENLPFVKITVYRKGLLKKRLIEVHGAASGDAQEFPTVQEAREALGLEV